MRPVDMNRCGGWIWGLTLAGAALALSAENALAQTQSYRPVGPSPDRRLVDEEATVATMPTERPAQARNVSTRQTKTRRYDEPVYEAAAVRPQRSTAPVSPRRESAPTARSGNAAPRMLPREAAPPARAMRGPQPGPIDPHAARSYIARQPQPSTAPARSSEPRRATTYRRGHDEAVHRGQGVRRASYDVERARFDDGMPMESAEEVYPYQEGFESQGYGDFHGMRGPGDGWHRYPDGPCEPYGGCDTCGTSCGSCGTCCHWGWWDDFDIFGGAHAFKTPLDFGRNGNFGLHEGFNWGGPLWQSFGMGYQLGFQAVHSNFSGNQTLNDVSSQDRTQYFITGGIFRRLRDCRPHELGFQWGVAGDWRHDEYYANEDLFQLRAELSVFFTPCDEFGALVSVNSDNEEIVIPLGDNQSFTGIWEVTDQFKFFYRRQFPTRGEGRLWGGFTQYGDGIVGGDYRVSLSHAFALDGNFNYVIPQNGVSSGAQQEEAWNLVINLVWYPGKTAVRANCSRWRPLFPVADNGSFLVGFKQ